MAERYEDISSAEEDDGVRVMPVDPDTEEDSKDVSATVTCLPLTVTIPNKQLAPHKDMKNCGEPTNKEEQKVIKKKTSPKSQKSSSKASTTKKSPKWKENIASETDVSIEDHIKKMKYKDEWLCCGKQYITGDSARKHARTHYLISLCVTCGDWDPVAARLYERKEKYGCTKLKIVKFDKFNWNRRPAGKGPGLFPFNDAISQGGYPGEHVAFEISSLKEQCGKRAAIDLGLKVKATLQSITIRKAGPSPADPSPSAASAAYSVPPTPPVLDVEDLKIEPIDLTLDKSDEEPSTSEVIIVPRVPVHQRLGQKRPPPSNPARDYFKKHLSDMEMELRELATKFRDQHQLVMIAKRVVNHNPGMEEEEMDDLLALARRTYE